MIPLFETRKENRHKFVYRLFAVTNLVCICLILVYRAANLPSSTGSGRWAWIGMLTAELWFGLYWIITQSVRWNPIICRVPFIHRLSNRYENELPDVDVFVCTADPQMEPPSMVMSTILSIMSGDYPTEKLSIYLSDDGGSEFTFYALIEASRFAKCWIPFCKKFNVEPRSPHAYFDQHQDLHNVKHVLDFLTIKKQYEEMNSRIESAMAKGSISEDIRDQHEGLSEWNSKVEKSNHQPIVKVIIDGRDEQAVDNDGCRLPAIVYVAREKRPQCPHNFKAGAVNTLLRVSSEMSNGSIILGLDCDMYANSPHVIREALCFFMDEEKGHQIAYVQHPQNFNNITKNDLYANSSCVANRVELAGIGGYDAALYCGTGCFHRRESLSGAKFSGKRQFEAKRNAEKSVDELQESCKVLASCGYEKGTQWGKEMGLIYGCPVEDIVTGLAIQCRGWKSIYYNPEKASFLGVAPNTLDLGLVQFKRWSEGLFQVFLSKYCPFIYGNGKISLGAQMGYCIYLLWAPNSLPTIYYTIVPPLCLLHGIPLFPRVSSLWFLPFSYVFLARNVYNLLEVLNCRYSVKCWWNMQRMWLIRTATSYFFAFIDVILKQLGLSETGFAVTPKVVTEEVAKRYEAEMMEFGNSCTAFTIISTLAMLNFFALSGAVVKWVIVFSLEFEFLEKMICQVILSGIVTVINWPVYEALFVRRDGGCLPYSVMFKSVVLASMACLLPVV
ncbi:hypothetical protein ACFE04_005289 [Oxalis oulophora]